MKAYKTIHDLPREKRIKAALGRLIAAANPKLAAKVRAKPFTQPLKHHERLLRNARQHQAIAEQDHETLHQFLIDYWSSPFSQEFFTRFADRFEKLFLKHHLEIVSVLSDEIDHCNEAKTPHLVELGCGDGKVLNFLSENLKQLSQFTGLDLSKEEIANCVDRFPENKKLTFLAEDIFPWFEQQEHGPHILFTNGGVLEYFTREQVISLFNLVKNRSSNSWIALTETIATDHYLESEPESFPYGREMAFSHNYPALLEECGFSIIWTNDRFTQPEEENYPNRWFQIVAKHKS